MIAAPPWPEDARLSPHTAVGGICSPETAYARLPDDAKLAAAIVDAVIWDDWGWAETVLMVLLGVPEPRTSSRTAQFFAARGWRDVADVYDAAHVSRAQRQAFELHLAGHTNREIGGWMSTSALAAKLQVFRAVEKLRRVVTAEPDVTPSAYKTEALDAA